MPILNKMIIYSSLKKWKKILFVSNSLSHPYMKETDIRKRVLNNAAQFWILGLSAMSFSIKLYITLHFSFHQIELI